MAEAQPRTNPNTTEAMMCTKPCNAAEQVFYLVLHEEKPRVHGPQFSCMLNCPYCTCNHQKALRQRETESDKDPGAALL